MAEGLGGMTEFWPWVPILTATFFWLGWKRLLAYLRYFQQEGYDYKRFLRWTNVRPLTDPAFWVAAIAALLFLVDTLLAVVLFTVGAIVLAIVQPDPRSSGKITLKLTWRAIRIRRWKLCWRKCRRLSPLEWFRCRARWKRQGTQR